MSSKISWDMENIDKFIVSFASNTEIENNKNAIVCGNVIKSLVQDIMTMDYTTNNKSQNEVLVRTKANEELFKRFDKLYKKVKKITEGD